MGQGGLRTWILFSLEAQNGSSHLKRLGPLPAPSARGGEEWG